MKQILCIGALVILVASQAHSQDHKADMEAMMAFEDPAVILLAMNYDIAGKTLNNCTADKSAEKASAYFQVASHAWHNMVALYDYLPVPNENIDYTFNDIELRLKACKHRVDSQ
jgi:hypothetical protein